MFELLIKLNNQLLRISIINVIRERCKRVTYMLKYCIYILTHTAF